MQDPRQIYEDMLVIAIIFIALVILFVLGSSGISLF